MPQHSKFPLFALLALPCAAVSGCTHDLSSDPKTAEDILRASTEHGADVTLVSGKTIHYCYRIAIRNDSTRWQSIAYGEDVPVPTDSIYSIVIANPHIDAGLGYGALGGAALGGILGRASYTPPSGFYNSRDFSTVGGAFLGALFGGIMGAGIGGSIGTTWTREQGGEPRKMDGLRRDAEHERCIYPVGDTLHSRDATQTKLPH